MTEIFAISPVSLWVRWGLTFIGLIPLLLGAWLVWSGLRTGGSNFEVSSNGLQVRGEYGNALYKISELKLDQARVVNLNLEQSLRPLWRSWGTALPGYNAGWFGLGNKQSALVYVSDWKSVIYIPTTKNHVILFSSPQAATILEKLRALQ
jgi:Bacterial PH domain